MPQHRQLISGCKQIASHQVWVNKMGLHLTLSHTEEDAAECCDQWLMLSPINPALIDFVVHRTQRADLH